MFVASIAHVFAFPVTPYKIDEPRNWIWNIAHAANPSDFNSEVKIHANHFYGKIRTVLSKSSRNSLSENRSGSAIGDSEEHTKLLCDSEGPFLVSQTNVHRRNEDDDDDDVAITI
jgi:hypothetical protein